MLRYLILDTKYIFTYFCCIFYVFLTSTGLSNISFFCKMLDLNFGYDFADINSLSGLTRLDKSFLRYLNEQGLDIANKLRSYRAQSQLDGKTNCKKYFDDTEHYSYNHQHSDNKERSELIIQLAPLLDDFLSELFSITEQNLSLKKQHQEFNVIYECRRKFVQRYALKKYTKDIIANLDFSEISIQLKNLIGCITEESLAQSILNWQLDSDKYSTELEIAAKYCAFMVHNHSKLMLFDVPRLVEDIRVRKHKISQLEKNIILGFDARNQEQSVDHAIAHAKYCIYCHRQQKDSCAYGFGFKNTNNINNIQNTSYNTKNTNNTNNNFDKNGCPLKQKISEMHMLKSKGMNIAALAIIMIDNPLVAATGHRICNDCMKSCIYQKQDPVNTPLVESDILQQVLSLPWGVEIYLLLSKWNPLNFEDFLPKAPTNKDILVTGLGPAGFALSHYLLNEGHNITAIDGLKISPLEFDINKPIKFWSDITEPLSKREPQGFGGVAEYGITHRWDKNNLNLIRLLLERRNNFKIYGGVRLGSNITTKQAFDLGFDHIALCIGAGRPRFKKSADYFAKGVKTAADFLMNLQQGASYLPNSNSNLLLRMPAIVIGCGLTAIDSAVEILHYYPIQVEKFYNNWLNNNLPNLQKKNNHNNLNAEEQEIADEFIEHAKLFRAAKTDQEKLQILQDLGGVTICYRKTLKESPAYRLNHEEIEHATAIGVKFKQLLSPKGIMQDQYGSVKSVLFSNNAVLKAKSVLIAIGVEENKFQDIDNLDKFKDKTNKLDQQNKSDIFKDQDCKISYFGDCNQKYSGSVVKALASAKNGYKAISHHLNNSVQEKSNISNPGSNINTRNKFKNYVDSINYLSDNVIEITIYSPLCVQNFQPGQFFKLQNYSNDIKQTMKPLALTGAYVNKKSNLISFIIQERGHTSKLCRTLKKGDEVLLMGPTGSPTNIVKNKNVVLVGVGISNLLLVPVAEALKTNNCHVSYFANYENLADRFYPERIEKFADRIIWSCKQKEITNIRTVDKSVKSDLISSIIFAQKSKLLENIDHVICMGPDRMIATIQNKKRELFGDVEMVYSINSPMQCMMKGICGQCVQKLDDERGYIFSCICQDQNIDIIDFNVLQKRLKQNTLLEKINDKVNDIV